VKRSDTQEVEVEPFKFALGEPVAISVSGERGKVIARAEYLNADNQYLVHYQAADGRAVEAWWSEEAIESDERANEGAG
jgi:hypothetical protein